MEEEKKSTQSTELCEGDKQHETANTGATGGGMTNTSETEGQESQQSQAEGFPIQKNMDGSPSDAIKDGQESDQDGEDYVKLPSRANVDDHSKDRTHSVEQESGNHTHQREKEKIELNSKLSWCEDGNSRVANHAALREAHSAVGEARMESGETNFNYASHKILQEEDLDRKMPASKKDDRETEQKLSFKRGEAGMDATTLDHESRAYLKPASDLKLPSRINVDAGRKKAYERENRLDYEEKSLCSENPQQQECWSMDRSSQGRICSTGSEKDEKSYYLARLLEQLDAVDKTDAESALQAIDAIILEESRKCDSVAARRSAAASSHASMNGAKYERDPTEKSLIGVQSGVPHMETKSESEKRLMLGYSQESDIFSAASHGLDEESEDFVEELPDAEQRGPSTSRPDISDAVDEHGVSRPGAYASEGRAYGQFPVWGRIWQRSFRSFRHNSSRTTMAQSPVEIDAVLVDRAEEDQIRHQVEERVRREVEAELLMDRVEAVTVEVDHSKATSKRLIIGVVAFILTVAIAIGLAAGLTGRNDTNDVLAAVPKTICYDRFPGQGHPLGVLCTRNQTETHGGGVCNIVCKAFLDQTPSADVCITNAGACRSDIAAGNFTRMDAEVMLGFENTLEVLEMTGNQVMQVLNDGLDFALDPLFGTTGAYPYGNAIRYHVDANRSLINNVEVNPRMEGEWIPIEMDRVYKVVTYTYLAHGGDEYFTFANIPDDKRSHPGKDWLQALIDYAKQVGVIEDLPFSEYSTNSYIPPGFL